MLNLYRRHQLPCSFKSRRYRNCQCPIWVQGSLRGEYIRRGFNLRSGGAATELVRDWEEAGEIGVVKRPEIPTIVKAAEKFLIDARAQHLSSETIRKHENLLNRRFLPWCEKQGYRYLKQLGVEEMRQFRASWTDSANYATKNLERLRGFFRFCQQQTVVVHGQDGHAAVRAAACRRDARAQKARSQRLWSVLFDGKRAATDCSSELVALPGFAVRLGQHRGGTLAPVPRYLCGGAAARRRAARDGVDSSRTLFSENY